MMLYQLTCLISPQIRKEEAENLLDELEKEAKKSGEIKKREQPMRIWLAYPVQKQKEAFLASLEFESTPKDIVALNQHIAKDVKIIRYLIVKVLPEEERFEEEEKEKKSSSVPRSGTTEGKEKPKAGAEKEPSLSKEKADLASIDQELEKVLNE